MPNSQNMEDSKYILSKLVLIPVSQLVSRSISMFLSMKDTSSHSGTCSSLQPLIHFFSPLSQYNGFKKIYSFKKKVHFYIGPVVISKNVWRILPLDLEKSRKMEECCEKSVLTGKISSHGRSQ